MKNDKPECDDSRFATDEVTQEELDEIFREDDALCDMSDYLDDIEALRPASEMEDAVLNSDRFAELRQATSGVAELEDHIEELELYR